MGYNWLGLACGAAAVALFAPAHRAGGRLSFRGRLVLCAALAAAAAPAVYQSLYYIFPGVETGWLYEARSWRGSELAVLPLGALGGCAAAFWPRRFLVLWLLMATGAALGPFLKPVLAPVPGREFRDAWREGVCMQSTLSTCGPASLATIFAAAGRPAAEREIARAAHSYRGGTEAWYLARYARARGARAVFKAGGAGFPEETRWPAVVGVIVEDGRGHFVPILSREGDRYLVGDPMRGPARFTREQLEIRYRFTGFAMEVAF